MLKKRPLPTLIAVFFGLAASVDAGALGFGRAPQTAVLGQPLDFAVPLRLEPGESVPAECLSAEVLVGDRRVPPYQVRTSIEAAGADAATVHVITTPAVDEPLVTVTLSAGCVSRITRRFVLLADPPVTPSTTLAAVATAPLLLAEAPAEAASVAAGSDAMAAPNVGAPAAMPAATSSSDAPARSAAKPATPRQPSDAAPPRPPRKPAATPRAERRPAPAPVARLRLDVVEPVAAADAPPAAAVIEEAIAVVAEAASAARASALAASAAAQRISALEQETQALRAQAQASRDEATRWREQAMAASTEQRWFRPLWLAVLFLAGLCAWLAWRMRQLRQADQRSWLVAAAAASAAKPEAAPPPVTAPIPLVNSELELPPPLPRPAWPKPVPVPGLKTALPPAPAAAPVAAAPVQGVAPAAQTGAVDLDIEAGPAPAVERTDVLVPNLRFDEGAARDVSIEELLDLEQQAEFFVALGQDDAAIDLLVEHLRSTGGGSPLPYLKLLEIYRRRDEPQAYERTRARFNDRFNAYAPDWDSDLQGGRSLEEYEGIVPRLQQAWPRPLDAMAELEALLFRKSRGELFDLPAYREVLFLYALARDLLEREPSDSVQVDILLPLAEGDSPSAPVPLAADADSELASHRPTEPVDLDLSAPTSTDSLFDELSAGKRPR